MAGVRRLTNPAANICGWGRTAAGRTPGICAHIRVCVLRPERRHELTVKAGRFADGFARYLFIGVAARLAAAPPVRGGGPVITDD